MTEFALYACDCETDGLDCLKNAPIEITLIRPTTNECRTWCLKSLNAEYIQPEALRINGHKREDILGQTAEGRNRYRKPEEVLVEIENWVMQDELPAENRILLGHNVGFDRDMLEALWGKCNAANTFPFNGKYVLDTMQIELAIDYANGAFGEGYSLRNVARNYKVKQEKSHTAEDDTKVMLAVFREQLKKLRRTNEDTLRG